MIFNIQIDLVFGLYAKENWTGQIEITSSSTLEDLHHIIQNLVCFDNDHLYEFYIARTERSRDRIRFDDENEKIFTTRLKDIFPLPKNRNLYYMFDYGDGWLFKIKRNRNKPHEPVKGIEYPILIKEVGKKPEQYPDFDEDFAEHAIL